MLGRTGKGPLNVCSEYVQHLCVCVLATEPGKRANYIIKASLAVTFLHLLCMLLHSIRKGQRRTWCSCKTLLFSVSLPPFHKWIMRHLDVHVELLRATTWKLKSAVFILEFSW